MIGLLLFVFTLFEPARLIKLPENIDIAPGGLAVWALGKSIDIKHASKVKYSMDTIRVNSERAVRCFLLNLCCKELKLFANIFTRYSYGYKVD